MHIKMSGWRGSDLSVASYDDVPPQTDQLRSHGHVRPLTRPASRRTQQQQAWYPPPYYPQYPGPVPPGGNNLASYPYFAPQQAAASRWDGLDLFDEEEQERRKKGKELVPIRPMMNGPMPTPWTAYPGGGYGPGVYGPMGNPLWSALPPPQQAPVPLLTYPGEQYAQRKQAKHVRHYDEQTGTRRRHGTRTPPAEITVNREVDGILTPDSGDLTVHLTMDLEEDLEEHLDELNRLSRLGHFSSAKEFFNENLRHHIDNPYVLVQYADLLLHQGDFKGVTLLKDDAIYKREGEQSNLEELRILRVYWELLQILAKSHTLDTLSGVPTVLEEAVSVLTDLSKDGSPDRPISSTEIEILALTIRLTGHPVLNSKWLRYGSRALAAFPTLSRLYRTLLRQGRIWDFHDLVVMMPTIEDTKALTHDIFGKDLIPSLQTLVSDWSDSVHGYDASTTLGLLSIMTHILLEPVEVSEKDCIEILKLCLPLAISVVENDASSLKSQPYLRLLLAKSRFAESASRQAIDSLVAHLQSSQGVYYQTDISLLPIYVPSGNETPQWTPVDQPPELKDPVKLVLRSAVELGDMGTEVIARRELIRLSASPREEFDTLCNLQLSRQGDLNGYGLSLASKYLVSNTKEAKEDLAISISRLLSRVASTDYWDPSHEWILNMLLYKLEGRSPSTIQHMLERSHADYNSIEESLLREISRKLPTLKDWADQQQLGNSTQNKMKDTILRASSSSRRKSNLKARKSPASRRETIYLRSPVTRDVGDVRIVERDVPLMSGSKPEGGQEESHPLPRGEQPPTHSVQNGQQAATDIPRNEPETPVFSPLATPQARYTGPHDDSERRHVPPPSSELVPVNIPVVKRRQEEEVNAEQLRQKWEAEFNKRLEAEKESERERRNERMAILEGLKQQVDEIRREAIEQAERKTRAEAKERTEQLNWEMQMEEQMKKQRMEKEEAMAKAKAEATALEAKAEAMRKAAIEEMEKKMKEESEMRKKREIEARKQAELEIQRRIEAEKRAYEEAAAATRLREELLRKAEAEERERREAEARAFEAAMKQAEEEEYREKIRQWADERAKKDLENERQIHLKDAVGRKIAIPFAQGSTWEGMQELIESAFRHVDVVGPHVREGHYDLVGPDGAIILPQAWDQTVKPGWNITMQMWPIPTGPPSPPISPPIIPPFPPIAGLTVQPSGRPTLGPPPPPQNWRPNDDATSESDAPARNSEDGATESVDDSSVESYPLPRRVRIANAWLNLKDKVLRRNRRDSWASTGSSEIPE